MASSPKDFFDNEITKKLNDKPELAQKANAIYQFEITGDSGGEWVLDLTKLEVREGRDEDARCTVTVLDEDFMKVIGGEMNPQMAFMSGKLKIGGDMTLAMKLTEILV